MQRKYINRLARVQDDGTVQFDVPGDIKPQQLDFGTGVVHGEPCDEKPSSGETEAEVLDIRPLQIVMLIVGTRGDVQPFVAIGKSLQVLYLCAFSFSELISEIFMTFYVQSLGMLTLIVSEFVIFLLATFPRPLF